MLSSKVSNTPYSEQLCKVNSCLVYRRKSNKKPIGMGELGGGGIILCYFKVNVSIATIDPIDKVDYFYLDLFKSRYLLFKYSFQVHFSSIVFKYTFQV